MAVKMKASRRKEIQDVIKDYIAEHNVDAFDPGHVADWAYKKGRLKLRPQDPVRFFRREIARIARAETYRDDQGREVRVWHPAQTSLGIVEWKDIRTAPPEHMEISFQNRRNSILYDVRLLNTDMESYNANNPHHVQLALFDFNFNLDLAESAMPTDYPDAKPGEGENDDEDDLPED